MGYTVWVTLTRARPLDGGECERLNAHVARHQRPEWPEPYRLKLTLGKPDSGLALTGQMKVGYDAPLVERFIAVLTELRGLVPDATCEVHDDLEAVYWDGAAYVLRGQPSPRPARAAAEDGAGAPTDRGAAPATEDVDDRAEKVALTKVQREDGLMYYVKTSGVWAVPRKKPGQDKGEAIMIAEATFEMDHSCYLYFVDRDGDIARKRRRAGVLPT